MREVEHSNDSNIFQCFWMRNHDMIVLVYCSDLCLRINCFAGTWCQKNIKERNHLCRWNQSPWNISDHSTFVQKKAVEDFKQGVEPLLRCPGRKNPALAGYKQSKLPCGHSVCAKCALAQVPADKTKLSRSISPACFNLSVVWAWSIQVVFASSTFWFLLKSLLLPSWLVGLT